MSKLSFAVALLLGAATVAGIAGTAGTAVAADARYSPAEAALLAAEDALFAADVKHDVAAIERGFADEAIFVHANGMIQTKADYLKATAAATMPVKSVVGSDRVVKIFGAVGVVRGTKTLEVGDMHLSGSYLTVYVMRDGRWQMLDEQSAPAPRPAGSPQDAPHDKSQDNKPQDK
jgi:hypothetical protein